MINVAVLGYGTVGSGVVEVIETNKEVIDKRAGEELHVKYILDLRDFPGDPYEDRVVHDYSIILNDPEVSIICETMGGNEPAFTFSMQALKAGKSVCTSNKELVANHGAELIRTARENCCNYLFEASVGGGIPIIRPLNVALTAERIELINGILNGTTNYILTKMAEEGSDFDACLKEAQEKGYAERNPEADVEGYDACRKIAILSSLMTGKTVRYEDIYTEGITKITKEDFLYAKKMNKFIKLLGERQSAGRRICGDSRALYGRRKEPAAQRERCFQCHIYQRKYPGRLHVLWKGSRKASDRQRGGIRCDRLRKARTQAYHLYLGGRKAFP